MDARRQFVASVAHVLARGLLPQMAEFEEAARKHGVASVPMTLHLARKEPPPQQADQGPRFDVYVSVSAPKTPRPKPRRFNLSLTEEQMELFG